MTTTTLRQRPDRRLYSRVLALLGLLALFLFLAPPEPTIGWNALFDVGHFVLFFFGTWIAIDLIALTVPELSPLRRTAKGAAITLLVAALSEAAQTLLPSRVPSALDLLRDSAGIAAAAAITSEHATQSRVFRAGRSRYIAASLFAAVLLPSLLTVAVYHARDRHFPVLATLEDAWWERWLLTTQSAIFIPAAAPTGLATFYLQRSVYPGLTITEPYPDWTGFTQLTFWARLDGDRPITLGVHIHDRWYNGNDDDRFNQNVAISPGIQHVGILLSHVRLGPRFRSLDMTAIRGIRIYAVQPDAPVTVQLSAIRLQ